MNSFCSALRRSIGANITILITVLLSTSGRGAGTPDPMSGLLLPSLGAAPARRALLAASVTPAARAASAACAAPATATAGAVAVHAPPTPPRLQPWTGCPAIARDSVNFSQLRARGNAYVDKTGAIADLLMSDEGMLNQQCAFFARPRKFGKSLTLDVAAEMLAAGALPASVAPWPGYVPVDVDAIFGSLAVHARLRARDPALRGLLERAHFVVRLELGGTQTGAKLEGRIISSVAGIAGAAFGGELELKVRSAVTPDDAVEMLVRAVPRGVPVALLVDEYDGAIIRDVTKGLWAAADAGIDALRSLLMVTKSSYAGSRIMRCLVTGVARFARTSLFSGVNNFSDLTNDPLLSRVLGFSEAEIRAAFPLELARLARSLGTDVDGAVAELARWYNGYSFDGATSCFNPFPVLEALRAGNITERELEAASGTKWLSLTPGDVVDGLATELQAGGALAKSASVDVMDLEARRVRAVPLLLQTGLLSAIAGRPGLFFAPNEYARRSMQLMVATALNVKPPTLAPFTAALRARDRAAFSTAVTRLFELIPRTIFKRDSGSVKGLRDAANHSADSGSVKGPREAVYHAALFAALKATAPPTADVQIQWPCMRGVADIVVTFSGAPHAAAWIIEMGLGGDAAAKLPRAQQYAQALDMADVFCCAIVVNDALQPASVAAGGAALAIAWSQRVDGAWLLV